MDKKEKFWMGAAMLFLGVVIGFTFAPIKKGLSIGNNNGNNNGNGYLEDNFCDDGDCDDECESNPADSEDLPF